MKKCNIWKHIIVFVLILIYGLFLSPMMMTCDYAYATDYYSIIPESYQDDVSRACNGVTIDYLDQATVDSVEKLSLQIEDADSLEFLKEFNNLKTLELTFSTVDDRYCLDTVPSIPSLTNLTIKADENLEISFASNNGIFLNNENNLERLHLSGVNVGPDCIEQLHNLKSLTLDTSLNNEIDYASLDLDRLDLSWYGPYDVPIFLSYKEYKALKEHDVEIYFDPAKSDEDYIKVWQEISKIAEGLSQSDSERDILDSLTAYTIEALEYDKEMLEMLDHNISNETYVLSFYEGGNLYGALEKDSSICGNYAALIKALAEYYDIESFYVINNQHAWNLVLANGELGYVDATSLDLSDRVAAETIRNGNGRELWWYMEDTDKETGKSIDGREPAIVFPEYMNKLCDSQSIVESEDGEEDYISQAPGTTDYDILGTDLILIILTLLMGAIVAMYGAKRYIKKTTALNSNQRTDRNPDHAVLYWERLKKKAMLGQSECLIGSKKGIVNLCVDNRIVSRIHARIMWTDHGYYIKDMGSTNGTFINERPVVNRDALLHNGDIIRLGNECFQFRYDQ